MSETSSQESGSPETRRVTLRDIAREVGVSHVTVSKALRNQSGASDQVKARILQKAEEMGYRPDPMLSALSLYRKTSKEKPVQATLAWINTWPEPAKLRLHKEFNLYWEGAADTAEKLGFHLEEFALAEIPLRRLDTILKTRNIQGILLPPLREPVAGFDQFNWSGFAVIRFGHAIPDPKAHFVTSAQMTATMLAFDRAHQLGYERIGFVCEYWRMRFFGVGFSWAQKTLPPEQQLPLLGLKQNDKYKHQIGALDKWLKKTNPDAILTDNAETLRMLRELGYRIPEDIGLATTSIHDTPINAGIDQRPYEIGRAAVRTLVSLLVEKSFGIPECRNEILIEGKWIDGSMLPPKH